MASNSAPSTLLQVNSGTVLTVGAGMEFATLADACRAATSGETIAVQAGTYLNDFATVSTSLHIVAVGGMVNEVATMPPPNDKGLLTVDANLSIQGFSFTGGSDGSPDGNVSGIRLESGNLAVSYCYFHDMQEGLLADPDATATVTIDHSEFAHNGTGDGYSHNLYVGAVAALTITNSYFHDAVVGHEIKSRAAVTTITNNVIADGPNGTASYDIDLPNGGVGRITGNIIEKGPMASNSPVIHYGGETQYAWANNSLTVSGNTILNDLGPLANIVLNQSALNGLTVGASITGNHLWGFSPAALLIGPGTLSGNTNLAAEPAIVAPATWSSLPTTAIAPGPQRLNLTSGNHTVSGGAARLTLNDSYGSNTVHGGAGGLVLAAIAGWDTITTQANASDQLTFSGRNSVVQSAGTDRIFATGLYEAVEATGAATITSTNFSSYALNGANEQLLSSASCNLAVGASGNARVVDSGGDIKLSMAAGARLAATDQATSSIGGAASTVTVVGGASGTIANSGTITITAGDAGTYVQAGTGTVIVAGGAGADTLTAGSGADFFTLGGGADQVVFGSGAASVGGGSGVDTYHFRAGAAGHDTISGFKQGVDSLKFDGFTGNPVTAGTIAAGSTVLVLSDGTTITLAGVALPGYPSGGGTATGGTAPAPIQPQSGGTTLLTSGGHTVTGGAALLTLTDQAGGNTIVGGAGGLLVVAADGDVLRTAAASANLLTLAHADTLTGAGTDTVTVNSTGNVITEAAAGTIILHSTGNLVQGGAGLLAVTDTVGGDTIIGGAGGISATLAGWYDVVTTATGAADTVSLAGYSTLLSRGADQVTVTGLYNTVTQTGSAGIVSLSAYSSFDLEGHASVSVAGGGTILVGQHASATIASASSSDLSITKLAGGTVSVTDALASGASSLSIAGGAATVSAATGLYAGLSAILGGGTSVTGGTGGLVLSGIGLAGAASDTINGGAGGLVVHSGANGVVLAAGSGNVTLTGGAGRDVITGGSGQAWLNLGSGADVVTLGSGAITVQGGFADQFVVPGTDATGSLTVLNWTAQDRLLSPIAGETVGGGSLHLTMVGGAQVELVGVTHFI